MVTLLNEMFNIEEEQGMKWTIRLNPGHFIYKAHFPGHPVTPGICITQIIGELLERHEKCHLQLQRVVNLKFTGIIDPVETPKVIVAIDKKETTDATNGKGKLFSAKGTITNPEGTALTKFSLEFTNE